MNWLSNIPIIGNPVITILAFIVVIGIVVFVHEYGHYIVGRWRGIHAEVFSLGFGPVIYTRVDKRGTRWQLAMIPLGGYVKFLGDRNAASETDQSALEGMNAYDRRRSFPAASVFSRSLTVLAGPVANFILSIAIFASLILWQGVTIDHPTFGKTSDPVIVLPVQNGDRIIELDHQVVATHSDMLRIVREMDPPGDMQITVVRNGETLSLVVPFLQAPVVQSVMPFSPAEKAKVAAGDIILEADGVPLVGFSDLQKAVAEAGENEIILTVLRSGHEVTLSMTPEMQENLNEDGEVTHVLRIGILGGYVFSFATETPPVWDAMWYGVKRTYGTVTQSVSVIKHIFLGNISASSLQGPVGIAQISGKVVKQGAVSFISLIAIISTSIGFLNLLPIPVLDGGHLSTYIYEALRGRPPSPRFLNGFMSIGLALVLFLMVFTLYNDIMRL